MSPVIYAFTPVSTRRRRNGSPSNKHRAPHVETLGAVTKHAAITLCADIQYRAERLSTELQAAAEESK